MAWAMRTGGVLFAFVVAAGGCGGSAAPDAAGLDLGLDEAASNAFGASDLESADLSGADGGPHLFPWGPGPLIAMAADVGLGAPVLDATPDEADNLWAVTPDALYVRRVGAATFRRYTNADGLHISYGVSAVAGAGPNEGYVGLVGYEDENPDDDTVDQKHSGKAEHVRLHADGTIESTWYWNMHVDVDATYWKTRSARRLLYGHVGANASHLYLGGNHGVVHIFDDEWGDHVHVEISAGYGEWLGLALDSVDGELWACNRYGCGRRAFDADPRHWVGNAWLDAFTVFTADHGLDVPPDYREDFVGCAVTPDGTAWFLSRDFGLASWDAKHEFDYKTIVAHAVPALGTPVDIAADLDGTLWLTDGAQLLRFDPASGATTPAALPFGDIHRLYLDARSTPRSLFVATGGGLVIYRGP
jgi:hypothetical protein